MSGKKTGCLLDELERLRSLLRDELRDEKERDDHLEEHIPILTDIADELRSDEPDQDRQTVAVLSINGAHSPDSPESLSLQSVDAAANPEALLKHQLRQQARLIIREIIDEELVRVEAQLHRELHGYLEHLLETMPLSQSTRETPEQES